MNRIHIYLLFLFASSIGIAQQPLSLEDAIKFAMQNNLGIKNARVNIADAEARIYENRATGLPSLSGTIDWQTFFLKPKVALPASFANGTSLAMSPAEYFAELYALYYDIGDKQRKNIPADVKKWLDGQLGEAERTQPSKPVAAGSRAGVRAGVRSGARRAQGKGKPT